MANQQSIAQSPAGLDQPLDDVEDVDEPPELRFKKATSQTFQRTTIRRPSDYQPSLLTKAILGQSDDETPEHHDTFNDNRRRRSMASNVSVASTADLTSDTGLTSPARTNTPSPPLPEMAVLRIGEDTVLKSANVPAVAPVKAQEAPRKRCIQFACNAKPQVQERSVPMEKTPSAQETTRRPCIKFACPARPSSTQNTPPASSNLSKPQISLHLKPEALSQGPKSPALAAPVPLSPRQATSRRSQSKGSAPRPKFIRATSVDLARDGSQFHEFARAQVREDDWIRQDVSVPQKKLTINDTLVKENNIRRLATEAEEEELEDEDEEGAVDEDELEEDDDDDVLEDEYDEDDDDEEDDDDADGYSTDEETGFADSDEEDDGDENMILWTPVQHRVTQPAVGTPSKICRPPLHEQLSDSSTSTASARAKARRGKPRRISVADEAPDLPDSTDFVCGTLDEDRPLEEAYLSCLAARRNEKLRIIPQDIDPSFPASDPEDEEEEELYNPVHHSSDDEETWMQGKMEDLDHEQGRTRRKRRGDTSPKRYRSPPPKARGRSPKPLFDRGSPRRVRSPAPKALTTPAVSPRMVTNVKFQLAGRPGLVHTKSLPRPAAFFLRNGRYPKNNQHADGHIRGAIDIVKGLEKKRQRRKEKFHQKYCDRARRGQIPERKPLPGRGAERMRELGLLMAGKKDQGNYVLSI